MGYRKTPKTSKMYARVHPWVKEWFDEQKDYNAANALEYVASKKGDSLELLRMKLKHFEAQRDEVQMELISIEMTIEEIEKEIYRLSPDDCEDDFVVNILEDVVISIATRLFNQYGHAHSIDELLNNERRVKGLRSEANKLGVDLEEFKERIIFEYNKLCHTCVSDISSENLN